MHKFSKDEHDEKAEIKTMQLYLVVLVIVVTFISCDSGMSTVYSPVFHVEINSTYYFFTDSNLWSKCPSRDLFKSFQISIESHSR